MTGPKCPGMRRDSFVAKEGSCDLHAHTTASDGRMSPAALTSYAATKGLKALGICDHDTVEGVRSLFGEAPADMLEPLIRDGVEIVPGVEINALWEGSEVHILGYYAPFGKGPFHDLLERMRADRVERVSLSVEALSKLGMKVELSRVMELSGGGSVGRPHVARAMVEKGYVSSIKEGFDLFLGIGKPAYVDRAHLSPYEAVRAISAAGGVAVWAHPGISGAMGILPGLVRDGLSGIEAYHPEHSAAMSSGCLRLAREFGLIVTGGSDFHGEGSGEGGDLGSAVVPYATVSTIRALAFSRR